MRSCWSASRPSMGRAPANSSASRSTRPPSRVYSRIKRCSPGAGACVRWRAQSSTAATAGREAGPLRLNRRPASPGARGTATPTHSGPGPAGHGLGVHLAVQASSRRTGAPLFCALVIPGDFFPRRSAVRLFRFTHMLSPARLGRPLPNTSRPDASLASQCCH